MYKYNTTDLDLQIASKHTGDVELGRRRNEHHQNDGPEKALSSRGLLRDFLKELLF